MESVNPFMISTNESTEETCFKGVSVDYFWLDLVNQFS